MRGYKKVTKQHDTISYTMHMINKVFVLILFYMYFDNKLQFVDNIVFDLHVV